MLRQTRPMRSVAALGLYVAMMFAVARPAWAQEAPDALVKRVSQDVLTTIKADPLIQAGNQARIREVIEAKLLPNFDFMRMTALAMGRTGGPRRPSSSSDWLRSSSRCSCARTPARSTSIATRRSSTSRSARNPGDTDVTVRTAVVKPGGTPVQIDYSMEKKAEGWKCYDVVVGGVSLVTNYRDEFNEQIRNGGIDGLVKTLSERNRGVAAK